MEDTIEKPLPTIDSSALDAAPPAAAPAQPGNAVTAAPTAALDLRKLDLSKVALAGFAECEEQIRVAEETLKDVVHDLSTPTKLKDAISLRNRLVKTPRTNIGKLGDAIRARMRKAGKDVTEHEAKLAAEFDHVELHITPQIEARQAEIAADEQREADRKTRHTEAIAKIAGMLNGAEDKSAERLAKGIEIVDGLLIEGFEEYQQEAEATRTRVLSTLKALHQKALDREAAAKLLAAQTLALELGQRVMACMTLPSAEIREHIDMLRATEYAPDVPEFVLRAHHDAVTQMGTMLTMAEAREKQEAELAALRAAQVPAPVPPAPAPEPAAASVEHQQEAAPLLDLRPAEAVSSTGSSSAPILDVAAPQATHIELRPGVLVKIPEPDPRPPLTTGALSERLGFIVAAGFVERLGITPAPRPDGAKSGTFWHAVDFPRICEALTAHLATVRGIWS